MASQTPRTLLAAVPDLLFGSKVSGVAGHLGIEVRFAATREALVDGARSGVDLVLVDLDASSVEPVGAIREIRDGNGPRVVAFASHVHEDRLAEARAAGCDEVHTRGSLAASLPAVLAPLRSQPE